MTRVTYTEILVLAIGALDAKIAEINKMLGASPSTLMKAMVSDIREPLNEKRETLTELYKVETGEDYA